VVLYDDVAGTSAARAWWLLCDHGHRDVRLLDGGWSAYVAAGGPVESGAAEVAATPGEAFPADPGHLPVVDAEGAARLAREGVLLDARAPERYRGETEPVDPVAGHIPGAVNVPTAANLAAAGARFRVADDLSLVYEKAAGAAGRPLRDVGVYCGSGVTAAHDVFALHLLGVEAALYPGSWSGWVADPERPVETS
jgi:thiosulfate/3-mercaptopyruvate sulfurtransferase